MKVDEEDGKLNYVDFNNVAPFFIIPLKTGEQKEIN
jgi:hypothetical protein